MGRPDTLEHLSPSQRQSLQQMTHQLEEIWETADSADLAGLLPPPGDTLRDIALEELVKADLEIRWRRGRPVKLEFYLELFPELTGSREVPLPLIYEEYRVRQLYGDMPPLDSYQARFPGQFDRLREMMAAHSLPGLLDETLQVPMLAAAPTPAQLSATMAMTEESRRQSAAVNEEAIADSDTLPIVGGYRKIKRLGKGSFGEVWRAEAPGKVEVAIKIILRPLTHGEAQRELQALELIKRLHHPFLLPTHAYWPLEDRLLIAMELADSSLADRLVECRKAGMPGIPTPELLRYFREAAEALDYLHSQHVQHRDIKPDNILILKRHAKVADFGVARLLENQASLRATMVGTPAFMPPEVWRGEVSEHTDQYSLAATYFELRLGHCLYTSTNIYEAMRDHMEREPDMSALPEAERRVLTKALAKEPKHRYPSCAAFVEALEQAVQPPPALLVAARRRPVTVAVLSLALVAMLGLFAWRYFAPMRPLEVTVRVGEEETTPPLYIAHDANDTIQWNILDPPNIRITPEDKGDSVQLRVRALPAAATGTITVVIHAMTRERKIDIPFKLTIEPPDHPSGCERIEAASETETILDKEYPKRVNFVFKDGMEVGFVLIPQKGTKPFYVMENKVWNKLFAKFAAENPGADGKDDWQLGGQIVIDGKSKALTNSNGDLPVLRVTAAEAYDFARWFAGKYGNLPSVEQWDKAAGRYEAARGLAPCPRLKAAPGKAGPMDGFVKLEEDSLKEARLGIRRPQQGPMGISEKTSDISLFGCRHMSGNGFEWTRTLYLPKNDEKFEELVKERKPGNVLVRAHDYAGDDPLTWKEIEEGALPDSWSIFGRRPDIGFRIVIELP